ncbi:MAG TPA: alpha/beta fold hydrolase [Candidatus Acidoferrales bacterium]|nr:alpha/beta fold hydrolase [Candidatus Acidoferrales bacterium]
MLTEFGPKSGNKIATVFVHGFTGDAVGTWTGVPKFLQADPRLAGFDFLGFGYPTTKSYDLVGFWSADPRIQEIALALSTEMSSGRMAQYEGVALVAHSMGGLVAQLALVNDETLRKRTTHLALFGTPSAGLRKAGLLSFWKRQIANMDAAGPFIKDLRARWNALGLDHPAFRFMAVAGELDQFVPPESSLLPFPESSRRVIPGNHLTMIQASRADDPAVRLLTDFFTAGAAPAGARAASRLALESRQFTRVIDSLGGDPKSLDAAAAVDLAIALDGMGRRGEAIAALAPFEKTDTDAMGTLAGRLKRTWLASRHRADAERALELYQKAYGIAVSKTPPDHEQAYYHGINIAFLELAYGGDIGAAQEMAGKTLEHCEAARRAPGGEHWRLATEGDALIILGRVDEGIRQHELAMQNLYRVRPWQALSIEEQSLRIADLCGIEDAALRRLAEVYQPPPATASA